MLLGITSPPPHPSTSNPPHSVNALSSRLQSLSPRLEGASLTVNEAQAVVAMETNVKELEVWLVSCGRFSNNQHILMQIEDHKVHTLTLHTPSLNTIYSVQLTHLIYSSTYITTASHAPSSLILYTPLPFTPSSLHFLHIHLLPFIPPLPPHTSLPSLHSFHVG